MAPAILPDIWRLALRRLRRQPGFFVPATLTLGASIAATLMVFALVNATLLRPLPFSEPGQLAWLWPDGSFPLTVRQFEELRPATASLARMSAMAGRDYAIVGERTPIEVRGATVSANHFDVFAVPPAQGRGFEPGDARPGAAPVAIISHSLWQGAFGADPAIVGRQVQVDIAAAIPMLPGAFTGVSRTIVGVLPAGYAPFGFSPDLLTPLIVDATEPSYRSLGELTVIGRLLNDEPLAAVSAAIESRLRSLPDFAGSDPLPPIAAVPLREALIGDQRSSLGLALGAVLLVLTIACANVAHLSLARLTSRHRELAVQTALGASRGRLARQLLAESFVVCCAGAVVGLGVAWLALPPIGRALPASFGAGALPLDARVLGFLVLVLGVTTLVAGAWPAMRRVPSIGPALTAERSPSSEDPAGWLGLHQGLIIAEVALAVVLVTSAGLILASLDRMMNVDPGFSPDGVTTGRFSPSDSRYRQAAFRRLVVDEILARVRALPGVESAGAIHFLPVVEAGPSVRVIPDSSRPADVFPAAYRVVTPGYFETMRIPLRRGRLLASSDDGAAAPTAVINERMAAAFWPGQEAVGQRLSRTNGASWEIVGVVGDVRQQALALPPSPELYLPMAQSEWANAMTIVARSRRDDPSLGGQIANAIHDVDPALPVTRVASMTTLLGESVHEHRFYSLLFTAFGALALGLGAVGVYGVAAYLAGRRRREIGIRLALGATRGQVMRRELWRSGGAVLAGLGCGVLGAIGVGGALRGLLFDIAPAAPEVLLAAVTMLGTIAGVAMALPIRRASRIDPLTVMNDG